MNKIAFGKVYSGALLMANAFKFDKQYWQLGARLNRSSAWLGQNVIKNPQINLIDLSPAGNSQNPRRYFIEREILVVFSTLAGLVEDAA